MIPRIIHQIWLQGGKLPDVLQKNVDDLKALNPGWEHRLYDSEAGDALISSFDDDFQEAYHRINPRYGAARADFLRHLIIYRHGGIYCDIKSGFSKPLDEVIRPDDTYVLSKVPSLHKELPDGEYLTYFLISSPAHPVTAQALHRIKCNILRYKPWNAVGRNGVLRTTGPIAYTKAIDSMVPPADYRLASEEELGAYPSCGGWMPSDHYSVLRVPVIRMHRLASAISRIFAGLRDAKRALR